jgi:sugar/nucleoside kinase (ribokinase family)
LSLLVVGSVAFDTVETPFGKADRVLGGSATFFVLAASYFIQPRLVGIVGADFPEEFLEEFKRRGVDLAGLQVSREGKTFHWSGRYEGDMNAAQTLGVSLNVLGSYKACVPESFRDSEYVFLANDHPQTQIDVLAAVKGKPFAVADTRDFWISEEPALLETLLGRLDGLVLNEHEARLMTGHSNLVRAGADILERGPGFVVIKKGEHGALLFSSEGISAHPGLPAVRGARPDRRRRRLRGRAHGLSGRLRQALARRRAPRPDLRHRDGLVAVEDFSVKPFHTVSRTSSTSGTTPSCGPSASDAGAVTPPRPGRRAGVGRGFRISRCTPPGQDVKPVLGIPSRPEPAPRRRGEDRDGQPTATRTPAPDARARARPRGGPDARPDREAVRQGRDHAAR